MMEVRVGAEPLPGGSPCGEVAERLKAAVC